MQIVEPRGPAPGHPHVVPGLVREPLHVVRHVGRQLDDGRAEAGLGPDARRREARLDERGEVSGSIFSSRMTGPAL